MNGIGLVPLAQNLPIGDLSNFAFFALINDFLRDEIDIFQWTLLQRVTAWVGLVALAITTVWVFLQGYRVATGQLRESAMALVVNSLRTVLIVALATSMAAGASQLYWTLTDGLSNQITEVVTGEDGSPYTRIDQNLALMQTAMMSIDALETGDRPELKEDKDRAMMFTGIGIAGPSVVAGAMLLLNKIAMALFIGLGPLFILCLLFDQTKQLFSKWLFYGIGTMFSLAVLSVMVGLATRMIGAVAVAYLARFLATAGSLNGEGINSMALQQGGLGLVLTTLIIMTPPMAAAFFNGVLGQFAAYSAFGQTGRGTGSDSAGRTPGTPGYMPISNRDSGDKTDRAFAEPVVNGGVAQSYRVPSIAHVDEIRSQPKIGSKQ